MNREEAQMVAFQLISYAGDAFSSFFKAVEKARNGEFDEADELIKKGESELTNAHNAQTELLAKEAQGKDIEYSIMLVHAQDHLMTTIMYERVAKEFITLYKDCLLYTSSYTNPATATKQNRFATIFDKLDNITAKTDGSHGKSNKEFAKLFKWCKY